jgi:hypothetical protein
VVERLMAKDPADRYATPAEAAEALIPFTQVVAEGPVRSPQRWGRPIVGVGLVLLVVAGVAAVLSGGSTPTSRATGAVDRPPASLASLPPTTPTRSEEVPLTARVAQERTLPLALDWFDKQAGVSLESKFVQSTREFLRQNLQGRANSVHFAIGGGLLRSKRTTLVVFRSGEVIEERLSAAQARRLNLPETAVVKIASDEPLPLPTPAVELYDLRIDQATEIDAGQPFRGSVSYRFVRPLTGRLGLRFETFPGTEYHRAVLVKQPVNPEGGRWSIVAPALAGKNPEPGGPVLFLVDLCTYDETNHPRAVVSNTAHLLLDVAPKIPRPEKTPTIPQP